jgi:SMC interacting uncharacterized protein involved in chromosome segregation
VEAQSKETKKSLAGKLKRTVVELEAKDQEVEALRKKLESWHDNIRDELDSAIQFITQQSEEISILKAELEVKNSRNQEDKRAS